MNDRDLTAKVHSAMYHQCQERGFATPVDVLMDIGVLKKADYESWRNGRVPYLERVCGINLSKLSTILHEMRVYAGKHSLKPSFCFYSKGASRKKAGRDTSP